MSHRTTLLLAALMTAAAAPAFAGPVPPGINEKDIHITAGSAAYDNHADGPGSFPATVTAGDSSTSETLDIVDSPIPSIHSTATLNPGTASGSALVRGITIYSLEILGAAGAASVRVDASGNVGYNLFTAQGFGDATAEFRVEDSGGTVLLDRSLDLSGSAYGYVDAENPGSYGPSSLDFTVGSDFLFTTNTIYTVSLRTSLSANVSGPGSTSMYSNVDPTFTVHGPYRIVLSDGFGGGFSDPASDVPEPPEWALMLVGFGGLGVALRRRARAQGVGAQAAG